MKIAQTAVLSVLGLLMCLPAMGADALMETAQQGCCRSRKGRSISVSTVFDVSRSAATA